MEIIIKLLDESKKNYGLIMNFWNDKTTFVTLKKWKCEPKKYYQSSVKIKVNK